MVFSQVEMPTRVTVEPISTKVSFTGVIRQVWLPKAKSKQNYYYPVFTHDLTLKNNGKTNYYNARFL